MIDLTIRNLELFFRDKTSVVMSLLAEIIIMVLYILFMRDNLLETFKMIDDAELIVDAWMTAGIIGITPLTASFGTYGIMVADRADKKIKDFDVSPVGTTALTLSYLLSAVIGAMILTLAILVLSEIYLYLRYDNAAGSGNIINVYITIVADSLCCASMMLLPASFIKTQNALAGCSTILGALIGFMTGIYLPVGFVNESVGMLVKAFPVSHGVVLLRQQLTEQMIYGNSSLDEDAAAGFMEYMGIVFQWGGESLSPFINFFIMLMTAAVFFLLAVFIRKFRKRC